jgi:two-component system, NtrC family, sensor kinase
MSIRTKITACFVFILVLFGAVAFYHYQRSEKTNQRLALVNQLFLPLSRNTAQLQSAVQGLVDDVRRYYFGTGTGTEDSTLARMVRDLYPYLIRRNFAAAETLVTRFANGESYELATELAELLATASRTFDGLSASKDRATFDTTVGELRKQLDSLESKVEEESRKITLEAQREMRETLLTGLALSCVLVCLGIVTLLLSHRALRSIPVLIGNLKQMADGDFHRSLKVHPSDVSETAELARQYNRMLSALRERDRKIQEQQNELLQSERLAAVGQLSAEIVHEIRNPLNSINLNIDWLDMELKSASPEISRTLGSISREVERLHQITESYLVRARIPTKGQARTPVNDLIREVVEFGREEDRSRGIQMEVALWPEEIYVQTERARMKQAFLNILRNAKEAMPRGGKIAVKTEVDQNTIRISVADSGSGMNDATKRKTFQPFFTTKPEGTGLGLMVTKTIVEEAHGTISCESNIGRGTTVYFQFPA